VYNALVEATGEQFWEIEMTCLAVRPPGYRGPAGPHVVFACTATVYGSRDKKYSLLFELRPDGTPRVLSSGKLPLSRFLPPPAEARLEQTSFGRISSMAMDPDGALFVAEHGPLGPTIFRIGPDGSVRLWCEGHYVPEPGDAFPDMLCREVTAMALDPVAGVIYAVAGRDLLRLEPINRPGRARGKATTLLRGPKPTHEPPGPSATAARDARLLYRPKGVLFRQGRLFLADERGNNAWVYDLRTGLLSNLVGDPSQALVRFGTVALAEPEGTAPGLCAALAEPRSLCPGPGDSLMIALPGSMVMIPGGLRLEAGENARARLAAQAAPAAPAP